ncbi:putative ankyrin repeat protein [Paratrimastix pyriformis]|uniref:Ankyrin repeat protein n=1 Tax=Paratrimastix pyriformis TaxID=342808 RepID=A0ABQ8UXB8_9EUKA|nr:putative ankyrin repeat protein [Paratrimastix pyriformis]
MSVPATATATAEPSESDIETLIQRFSKLATELTTPVSKTHLAEETAQLEQKAQQWRVEDLTRTRFVTDEPVVRLQCPGDDTIFEVSKSTLLREPGTFFSTLLSGRWEEQRKEDAPIKLPLEDAGIVPLLLNYMENGPSVLPHDPELLARLGEAAKCLCVITLQDYVQYPLDQFQLNTPDLQLKMRVDCIRHLFGQERSHPVLQAPYLDLVRVFDDPTVLQRRAPKFRVPLLLQYPNTTFDVVTNKDTFMNRFHATHGGALDGMDWSNMVVAGGSVLMSLIITPPSARQRSDPDAVALEFVNDVDIFLYGLDPDQAMRKIKAIEAFLRKKQEEMHPEGEFLVVRTHHALTFQPEGMPKVQVILRLYQSPSEVLYGFDIDCVSVLYDGALSSTPSRVRPGRARVHLGAGRLVGTRPRHGNRGRYGRRRYGPPAMASEPELASRFLFSELVRKTLFLLKPKPAYSSMGELPYSRAYSNMQSLLSGWGTAPGEGDAATAAPAPAPEAPALSRASELVGELMAAHTRTLYPSSAVSAARTAMGMEILDEAKFRLHHGLKTDSGYHDAIEAMSPFIIIADNYRRKDGKVVDVIEHNPDGPERRRGRYYGPHPGERGIQPGGAGPSPVGEQVGHQVPRGAVDLPTTSEWITVDLDRQFIGTFHHQIHAEFFDCYSDGPAPAAPATATPAPATGKVKKAKFMPFDYNPEPAPVAAPVTLPPWFDKPEAAPGQAGAAGEGDEEEEEEKPKKEARAKTPRKRTGVVPAAAPKKAKDEEDEEAGEGSGDDDDEEEKKAEPIPWPPKKTLAAAPAFAVKKIAIAASGPKSACPLCGKMVRSDLLQAHVNAELDGRPFDDCDEDE